MLLTLTKTYGALLAYVIVFSLADGIMVTTYIIALLNSFMSHVHVKYFLLHNVFSIRCIRTQHKSLESNASKLFKLFKSLTV